MKVKVFCATTENPTDRPQDDIPGYRTKRWFNRTLGPQAIINGGNCDFTADNFSGRGPASHIYFLAEARYDDVFNRKHLTKFCAEFTDRIIDAKGNISFSVTPCKSHNCIDEECEE
jgi:hypothetical protein